MLRWWQPVSRGLAVIGVAGLILGSILLAGYESQKYLAHQEQYEIPFRQIDCNPPAGMTREAFLEQVRYLSEIPGQINVMDPNLRERLSAAFRKHPRVHELESFHVTPDKQIHLTLIYRPR